MSETTTGREMSLEEWLARLSSTHRVNIEFAKLRLGAIAAIDAASKYSAAGMHDEAALVKQDFEQGKPLKELESLIRRLEELEKSNNESLKLGRVADGLAARLDKFEAHYIQLKDENAVMRGALERIAKNPGVVLTCHPAKDFAQFTAEEALGKVGAL